MVPALAQGSRESCFSHRIFSKRFTLGCDRGNANRFVFIVEIVTEHVFRGFYGSTGYSSPASCRGSDSAATGRA